MSDFKAKMYQIQFRLGIRPGPRWGSLQRSPDPLAGLRGPTSKGRGGDGKGGGAEGRGRGGEGESRGWEGTRPHPFTPLIHIYGYAPETSGKTIVSLCQDRKTSSPTLVVTFNIAHFPDRNIVS